MNKSLSQIRKDIYEIPFEIIQLEKEIKEDLAIIRTKRLKLEKLKRKYIGKGEQ